MVVHEYAAEIQQPVTQDTFDTVFRAVDLVNFLLLLCAVENSRKACVYRRSRSAGLCDCYIEHLVSS